DPVVRSTIAWRIAVVVQRTGVEFEWTVVGTGEAHLAADHAAEPDTRGNDGVGVSILRCRIDVTGPLPAAVTIVVDPRPNAVGMAIDLRRTCLPVLRRRRHRH